MFSGPTRRRTFVAIGCASLCLSAVVFAQKRPKIEALPYLDPSLAFHFDAAFDVTDEGIVVGESSSAQSQNRPVRWSKAGAPIDLGPANPSVSSGAYALSSDGRMVACYLFPQSPRVFQAARWTPAGGLRRLLTFGDPNEPSFGNGVSADGRFIVGVGFQPASGESRAVRWSSAGKVEFLGALAPGKYSGANDISDDGTVVGYSEIPGGSYRAFRWTESEGISEIGELPGVNGGGSASAISADGETIVGSQNDDVRQFTRGFVWTSQTGMRPLARLAPRTELSFALDVSGDGRIIVGSDNSDAGSVACLWIDGRPIALRTVLAQRDSNLDGWNELREIRGISPNGRVLAGTGRFRGKQRAFRVTLTNGAPTANAGADVVVETNSERGVRVQLDGLRSSDPEGRSLTFKWSAPSILFKDARSPRPVAMFPVGTTMVTLRVSDDLAVNDADAVRVTVRLTDSEARPHGSAANEAFADAAGWAETLAASGDNDAVAMAGIAYASAADSLGAALGDLIVWRDGESTAEATLRYAELRTLQAAYGRRAVELLAVAALATGDEATYEAAIAAHHGTLHASADMPERCESRELAVQNLSTALFLQDVDTWLNEADGSREN